MRWNAYHFVKDKLRNGDPVPADGELLRWDGPLEMCATGLHASRKAWQALHYAPGSTLCRVWCAGEMIEGDDKLVCRERTIVARINAKELLWRYARMCALDVAHLYDAPDVLRQYLKTGDEELRDAAWAAARAAKAPRDVSWSSTRFAIKALSFVVLRSTVFSAAWDARFTAKNAYKAAK